MLGAIIADIVGSPYEFYPYCIKTTDFPLFSSASRYTDDSMMTLAVAQGVIAGYGSIEKTRTEVIKAMRTLGRRYPNAGYGGYFYQWLRTDIPRSYGSYGNGSAMRVSSVAWVYNNLRDVERFAKATAEVTHDHPEGIKGAQATAAAIFLARQGAAKDYIRSYMEDKYGYRLDRSIAAIKADYEHVESCQESVPEAITAFLEGEGYEQVIRLAVSLGGDADTQAAIAGSIAQGCYPIPEEIKKEALAILEDDHRAIIDDYEKFLGEITAYRKEKFAMIMSRRTLFCRDGDDESRNAADEENEMDLLVKYVLRPDFCDYNYLDTLHRFHLGIDLKQFKEAARTACALELRAMATAIVEQEQFREGFLVEAIASGTIGAILKSFANQGDAVF